MQVHGEFSVENVLEKFKELRDERILKSEEHGWTNTPEQVNLNNIYIYLESKPLVLNFLMLL